jgi:hypothetical protein
VLEGGEPPQVGQAIDRHTLAPPEIKVLQGGETP